MAVAHATGTGRHHTAHSVVAGVSILAFYRPVWEVFDWVRPLQFEHGWTKNATLVAAFSAYSDFIRGTRTGALMPIGGVPEQALVSDASVMHLQTLLLTQGGGDWRTALDVVERYEQQPGDLLEQTLIGRSLLMIAFLRAMANEMSPTEIAEMDALGESTVQQARQVGSIIDLALCLAFFAYFQSRHRPADAVALATEAVDAVDGIGADALSETLRTCLAYSVSRVAALATPSLDDLVGVRAQMLAALEQENFFSAAVSSFALLPLLATRSADISILMWLVWRQRSGIDFRADLEALGIAIPDDTEPLEQRAARMSFDQVLGLVIDELDHLIAEVS